MVSFIQSPGCESLEEAAEGFDIDVRKVVYNFHTRNTTCSADVARQIKSGRSKVSGITFEEGIPGEFDDRIVERTVSRMRKYELWGFAFPGCDGVYFNDGGRPPE